MLTDIFNDDLFSTTELTAAINDVEYVPARLAEMFTASGIRSTSAVIEKSGESLGLVPAKQRGAPGTPVVADKRKGVTVSSVHLPQTAAILADEVQGVREFGSSDQTRAIETERNQRLAKMARRIDLTHEWHRIGAIRGKVLDADATTELVDLFALFGLTQESVAMALDTAATKVRSKALEVLEKTEDKLRGTPFDTPVALCGASFWRKLIEHGAVKESYLATEAAANLRGDGRVGFEYGGIRWERYRGKLGSVAFVPDTEAYVVPQGVEDLLITRFAPADYMEAVNTIGLPYYASAELMRHNKGIELESQSNPIHICTRPDSIIRLVEGASVP